MLISKKLPRDGGKSVPINLPPQQEDCSPKPGSKDVRDLTLQELLMKSQYRCLVFTGVADGVVDLTPSFNISDLQDRYLIIKSVRLVPYTDVAYIDFVVDEAGVSWTETIPIDTQVNRIFGSFGDSAHIVMRLNGVPNKMFSQSTTENDFPADLHVDNIFYLFPEKLLDWTFNVTINLIQNLETAAESNPNVQVVVECYLI